MNISCINEYIDKNFSEKRKIHTQGVKDTAMELAEIFRVDQEKAQVAALFHDMFRGVSEEALNYYVRQLKLDDKYLNNCNLAHSKIAAIIMERDYDVKDKDILNAVSYHTTGRPNMSPLEQVIYIADAVEPNRNYPGVDLLRQVARKDLNQACLISLENTIDFVEGQGNYLDEDTLLARDYFKTMIGEN